ncbi:MAG: HAD family phosphatase [Planctomycetota bacterium]
MLEALIFDFDGVIADSEPVHCAAIREVAATVGVTISDAEYRDVYIGFDDRDAFREVLRRVGGGGDWAGGAGVDEGRVAAMCTAKAAAFDRLAAAGVPAVPGSLELARSVRESGVPMAIASGATRREIEGMLAALGEAGLFEVMVTADDVERSKPDPQTYAMAVERLAAVEGRALRASRCVAIEDTAAGVAAAEGAGLRVVGVTTTGPAGALAAADVVVAGPADVDLALLERVARGGGGAV